MEQPGGEIRRVVCFPPDGKLDTVTKILHVGEKGGVYYVNEKGKRIYLKKYQYKQLLEQHQLNGAVNIGTLDFDSISPYKTRNGAAGTTQQALAGNAGQPVGGPAPGTRGRGRPRGSTNRGRGGATPATQPARSPTQQQSPQYSPAPMTPGDDNLQNLLSDADVAQILSDVRAMIASGEFMWDDASMLVRNPNYLGPVTPTASASAGFQNAHTPQQPSPYVPGTSAQSGQQSPFWTGSLANTPQQSPLYFSQSATTSPSPYIGNGTGSPATRGRGRGTRGRGRGSAPPSPAPAFTPQQQQQFGVSGAGTIYSPGPPQPMASPMWRPSTGSSNAWNPVISQFHQSPSTQNAQPTTPTQYLQSPRLSLTPDQSPEAVMLNLSPDLYNSYYGDPSMLSNV